MIRVATIQDTATIAELWNWVIRETLATFTTEEKSVAEIERMILDRKGRFFVAEEVGTLHGFVTLGPFRAGPGYAATCEHSVVVKPQFQRRGTGAGLMTHAIRYAENAGFHVMVGAISSANPQAVAFHTKMGFDEVGRMPQVGRKAGRWLDLILMQKILSQTR